jgi:hypothetical protein
VDLESLLLLLHLEYLEDQYLPLHLEYPEYLESQWVLLDLADLLILGYLVNQ